MTGRAAESSSGMVDEDDERDGIRVATDSSSCALDRDCGPAGTAGGSARTRDIGDDTDIALLCRTIDGDGVGAIHDAHVAPEGGGGGVCGVTALAARYKASSAGNDLPVRAVCGGCVAASAG